ncbi:3-oxoacyl-ACP reductase [Croceicoccus estronivorus]|uniref:SDR family NAD(P)-dependent oxidoreductase n=1 Tax=Croceicoccus estronivorus TaxID=1172626 RepID=UPI0008371969|nr:SDR family oxidoreductase [Croceicoccus estronivorus]OCC25614.1 3-oxoacyl-ACP reductase [Croceicoccus estronivorus]
MQQVTGALGGRKAVITGAASGIGRGILEAFVREGATVLAVDLPSGQWETSNVVENGVARLAVDVTLADAPARVVEAARNMLGGIDILVNNAGISPAGDVETTSDEMWSRVMALNVDAVFRLTRAAVPFLKQSGSGRIINTGSIMSEIASPSIIAYVTSKHAVAGMTKAMAMDLGQYGICANFLQPGAIVTPLSEAHMADEQYVAHWKRKIPLGRLGEPDDIGPVAVFLASDAARYVSGEGLRIDGGAAFNA